MRREENNSSCEAESQFKGTASRSNIHSELGVSRIFLWALISMKCQLWHVFSVTSSQSSELWQIPSATLLTPNPPQNCLNLLSQDAREGQLSDYKANLQRQKAGWTFYWNQTTKGTQLWENYGNHTSSTRLEVVVHQALMHDGICLESQRRPI